jgi:hypothetical protein
MRALSEKASASPSAIAMAPDAGSSESEEVEPAKYVHLVCTTWLRL